MTSHESELMNEVQSLKLRVDVLEKEWRDFLPTYNECRSDFLRSREGRKELRKIRMELEKTIRQDSILMHRDYPVSWDK